MEEVQSISPYYYIYMINTIIKKFDVVIIDSNSSLSHVTSYPLLTMANTCYYVLNLDYNNVRNNQRYKATLKNLGIYDKVKFVLNEDLSDYSNGPEKLEFNSKLLEESFVLEAKIPMIDKVVFMNRIWQAMPCILDDSKYTLKARYEISKVANQIYPIDNLPYLEREVEKLEGSKGKKALFKKK
jgi:cellulose biosynthesis protein BcsQ